jgi:hypothetical protein
LETELASRLLCLLLLLLLLPALLPIRCGCCWLLCERGNTQCCHHWAGCSNGSKDTCAAAFNGTKQRNI